MIFVKAFIALSSFYMLTALSSALGLMVMQ